MQTANYNEAPDRFQVRAYKENGRDRVVETQLLSDKIQIERKMFFFDLKENPRGRFLKITEEVGGRRDTIIIPSTGLDLFRDTVAQVIQVNKENPVVALPESLP